VSIIYKHGASVVVLLSWLVSISAFAQTPLQDPLAIIKQYESGGQNIQQQVVSPSISTASGYYQITNSTWNSVIAPGTGLPTVGPGTNFVSGVMGLTAAQQQQGAAFLYNQQGFSPWTCAGCNAQLAAAIQAAGGAATFTPPGQEPANGVTLGDGSILTSPDGTTLAAGTPTAPPQAAAGPSAQPFQWVYTQVINGIMGQVDTSIQTVESIASGPATTVLALAIAIMGIMTLFGNMDMPVFLSFAVRAAIVMAFIQVGNTYYSNWIEQFVLGLPDYFANAFSLTGVGGNPAQLFDGVMNGWVANALSVWHSTPLSFHAVFIGVGLALATLLIVVPSLTAMFTVFMISTFLLLVMLTIGPLMILALLFRTTHRFLHGYVNVMVTGIIFALVVDIVLGIFSSILTQVMANFTPSGSPDTDLPGLFGLAITMLITGFSMARLPRLVEAIGGGVAVSMDTAGRFVAGGFAADAAGAAASTAARVL
jgi:hypothetical protein